MSKGKWLKPEGASVDLFVYNSLTRKKDLFVPREGNRVRWYSCGPTVYDHAHMGHARNYITFDILRRVMKDYFNYDVEYVMNITDLDDKIILRARRNYLFEKYCNSKPDKQQVLTDAAKAIEHLKAKIAKQTDEGKLVMLRKILADSEAAIQAGEVNAILKAVQDPLSEIIDAKEGSTVSDPSLFTKLTQFFEADFFEDMTALNIQMPDALPRVTEYVEEIVEFVKKIQANGFAYESKGSVYFDMTSYNASGTHAYGKLLPEAVDDFNALNEGEGELSAATSDKRNPRDFALWKASRPGEPAWASPWGKGRPGWHIECSAMCHENFGSLIDIHTGGADLKFPHHENEVSQSEAFYGCDQWCNYFLHSGHLNIQGLKMSKSLKNFITIKQALNEYSARQLRLSFLTHTWNATFDYSTDTMREAVALEKTFNEFFLNIKSVLRSGSQARIDMFNALSAQDKEVLDAFRKTQKDVHAAFCDNIDTVSVVKSLRELVGVVNVYLRDHEKKGSQPHRQLLYKCARYVTELFKIMGVLTSSDDIGFSSALSTGEADSFADSLKQYREAFDDFYTACLSRTAQLDASVPQVAKIKDLMTQAKQNNGSAASAATATAATAAKQQQQQQKVLVQQPARKAKSLPNAKLSLPQSLSSLGIFIKNALNIELGSVTTADEVVLELDGKKTKGAFAALAVLAQGSSFLPQGPQENALATEWTTYANEFPAEKAKTNKLKVLNAQLEKSTFVAADRLTIVDGLLWAQVRSALTDLGIAHKYELSNLSRWADTLQHAVNAVEKLYVLNQLEVHF